MSNLTCPSSRLSLATCHGEALAETECFFIALQAMFHFRQNELDTKKS